MTDEALEALEVGIQEIQGTASELYAMVGRTERYEEYLQYAQTLQQLKLRLQDEEDRFEELGEAWKDFLMKQSIVDGGGNFSPASAYIARNKAEDRMNDLLNFEDDEYE